MAKSLSLLLEEAPPTFAQSVPDSCGEESSDEEIQPKPLSSARVVPSSSRQVSSSSVLFNSRGGGIRPNKMPMGKGSQAVQGANTKYFSVQW